MSPGGATATLYVHASVPVLKVAEPLGVVSAATGTTFAPLATTKCKSVLASLAPMASGPLHAVATTSATASAVCSTDVRVLGLLTRV
jgi:hypothetical protein